MSKLKKYGIMMIAGVAGVMLAFRLPVIRDYILPMPTK